MKLKYRSRRLIYSVLKDKSMQFVRLSAYLDMYISSINNKRFNWGRGGCRSFGNRGKISRITKFSFKIKPFHIRNSNKAYTKIYYNSDFAGDLRSLSINSI